MNPSRRSFLMKLGAGMIGALVVRPTVNINDIWKPSQRQLEFIGNHGFVVFTESDIVKIELERIMPQINRLYEQDDMFYTIMKKRSENAIRNS